MTEEIIRKVDFTRDTTKDVALGVIDTLRKDIEEGRIIGFHCTALEADDTVVVYTSTTRPITRLRMIGALSHGQHMYLHDKG